jgi:hypothetical protein
MRMCIAIFCIVFIFSNGAAQVRDDSYSIQLVKNLLQHPVQLGAGFSEKQVNRLGDRVSIALLKILDEQALNNPQQIRKFLPLIRTAFLAPQIIAIAEDKKPAVTLFLLRYLEANVQDGNLKNEIAQLMGFIKEKTTRDR